MSNLIKLTAALFCITAVGCTSPKTSKSSSKRSAKKVAVAAGKLAGANLKNIIEKLDAPEAPASISEGKCSSGFMEKYDGILEDTMQTMALGMQNISESMKGEAVTNNKQFNSSLDLLISDGDALMSAFNKSNSNSCVGFSEKRKAQVVVNKNEIDKLFASLKDLKAEYKDVVVNETEADPNVQSVSSGHPRCSNEIQDTMNNLKPHVDELMVIAIDMMTAMSKDDDQAFKDASKRGSVASNKVLQICDDLEPLITEENCTFTSLSGDSAVLNRNEMQNTCDEIKTQKQGFTAKN